MSYQLYQGDCLDILSGLDENSVDTCITDPPYGLSNSVLYDLDPRIFGAIRKIVFPHFDQRDSKPLDNAAFGGVFVSGSPLCRGVVGDIIESGIGVPECSIYLDGDIIDGQVKVNHGNKSAGNRRANSVLGNGDNSLIGKFLGDYTLDTGDSWELAAGNGGGSLVTELFFGGFSVPVAPVLNAGDPSSLARIAAIMLCNHMIGPPDNSAGQSQTTPPILAGGRTVNAFMLRFDMGRGTIELRATYRASQNLPGSFLACPKLVRTGAAAGSLAAEFEAVRVGMVGFSADGADSFYFHLWLRKGWIKHLNGIIPRGGFMSKDWDATTPETEVWREVYRVLKPGAMLLAFGGDRTHHRLMVAIEDAGFEIRDCLMWLYGSGFPKSLNVSKAIDKAAGAKGTRGEYKTKDHASRRKPGSERLHEGWQRPWMEDATKRDEQGRIYIPATPAAATWDGYGTSLKPAWEPVVLAMKPLDGTFAENALKWGVAGLWIDGGRIPTKDDLSGGTYGGIFSATRDENGNLCKAIGSGNKGRWPANLVLDENAAAMLDEQSGSSWSTANIRHNTPDGVNKDHSYGRSKQNWITGGYADSGGASRFFYTAKASRAERGEGNNHPTVKPLALMEYLCRLTRTPSGGIVLDPFMGSGTTGIACANTNRQFIGIEIDSGYFEIAKTRIEKAYSELRQETLFDNA